jgi:cytochrome c oxidase subunit 2
MLLRVVVEPRADFERWMANQQGAARQSDSVAESRRIFETTACVNCHTVSGTSAHGTFGPDLTHLMSRETVGAGAAPLTQDNLRQWIMNPDTFKPGSKMPAMQLKPGQLDAVTAYLLTLE